MKKIILSLSALFAVSIASAQSYPKQPDKTIVQYVSYQKPAAEPKQENATQGDANAEAKNTKEAQAQPAAKKDEKIERGTNPAILNSNKKSVAVADRKK